MPSYRVELKPSERRELEHLSNQIIARIIRRPVTLTSNPRPRGCKKLKGGDMEWRVRVGNYRVVYTIDDQRLLVSATRIRHRS